MKNIVKELPAGYTIQILKSIEEIKKVKSFWEEKQTHPDGDIDLFINIINSKKEFVYPYIILILLNKKPEAMMVGIIEKKMINVYISYKMLSGPKLRILTIIPERIFGNQNFTCSHFFVLELVASLKHKETDLVQLENFNIDSHIFKKAKTKPGFLYRDYYPETISHWKTVLPGTIDELFSDMGSKQRHELFRKERRIQEDSRGKITFCCYKVEGEIYRLCNDIENVSRYSLKDIIGYGFIINTKNKNYLSISAKRGWLRGYLLYIDEKPCAYYICHIYKEIFYFRSSGFNERYKNCSPGVVLLKHVLEDIYKHEKNIKEIDWGIGDQKFKKHLGNYSTKVGSLYIFPQTLYGFLLNCTKSSLVFFKTFVKAILIKFGQKDKISNYWRHRLIKKQSSKYGIKV
jgi:hypothetical protein